MQNLKTTINNRRRKEKKQIPTRRKKKRRTKRKKNQQPKLKLPITHKMVFPCRYLKSKIIIQKPKPMKSLGVLVAGKCRSSKNSPTISSRAMDQMKYMSIKFHE
jgi:hypothetical protein